MALARALLRRGASFTAAMAFEIASTNLVIELGIIMALPARHDSRMPARLAAGNPAVGPGAPRLPGIEQPR